MDAITSEPTTSGPNPPCDVGRRHPRDKHRMRPVDGFDHVWQCARHSLFARLVDKATAESYERGDAYPMHDGGDGVVVQHGDERQGGVILYYRAA
ncbi:MAG: hypothetical protein H0V37_13440 [Chloroflexia bacterium]|nr:hypothetical protein [Chloroflexia bacterium]